MQFEEDQWKTEQNVQVQISSVSSWFTRLIFGQGSSVLARPPTVHRTDTVHHSTKPEQRLGGRERETCHEAVWNSNHPTQVWCSSTKDLLWRNHQNWTQNTQRIQIILQHIIVKYTFLIGKNPELNLGHVYHKQLNCFWCFVVQTGCFSVRKHQHSLI